MSTMLTLRGVETESRWRYTCDVCGFAVTLDEDVPMRHSCKAVCFHRGQPIEDEVALIPCETCRGNVRKKFAVHHCGVFGKCVPKVEHHNAAGVAGCVGCPSLLVVPPPLGALGSS